MKTALKKIPVIFLFCTGSIPVCMTLFFLAKQQIVRHEMKEKLEQQYLQTITLPASEVYWIKNKKEILVDGKMFDIKSFSLKNDQYEFTGLFDDEETALVKQLENNTRQNNQSGNRLLAQFFQWLSSVYSDKHSDFSITTAMVTLPYHPILSYISSPFKTILTPPPRA